MPKINPLPPVSFLSERFAYDHETGELTYRETVSRRRAAGAMAGFIHWMGYRYVKFLFEGRKTQAASHRIAWSIFHQTDIPPTMEIDHIDRDKLNNRISNLRLVTRAQNARNTSATVNRSARRGVSRCRNGWRAYTYRDGRYVHLGQFSTDTAAANAVSAYEEASNG